ncbi:11-beta-hydroxysteroid dehydrogenase type 2-like [Brevipalpus obovatus]|uniref:11-beta-hydroxysteroid dehydrogenase type 2-like n=1 Tax=Brevipalpus obovatus TaxID=246614 RepID=UPI003D9E8F0F
MNSLLLIFQFLVVTFFLGWLHIYLFASAFNDQDFTHRLMRLYAIIIPVLAIKLVSWMNGYYYGLEQSKISTNNKAILIIDCDSDYGYKTAKFLNHLGFAVIAGCSNPGSDKSRQLITEAHCRERMHLINAMKGEGRNTLPFTSVESILNSTGDELYGLVINPPSPDLKLIQASDFEELCWKTMNSNFFDVIKIIRRFLPLLRKSQGRIVTLRFPENDRPKPLNAAYAASGQAIKAFMDSLRHELILLKVQVIEIEAEFSNLSVAHDSDLSPSEIEDYYRTSHEYPLRFFHIAAFPEAIKYIGSVFLKPEVPYFVDIMPISLQRFLRNLLGQKFAFDLKI